MRRRLATNQLLVFFKVFHEITGDRIFAIVADRPFLKNNHPNHTMKHSEWLRLQVEGDRVVASLRADGFNCRKQPRRLSWYLCKGSVSYTLTWLPAPVREWSLLPNDETPERAQLLAQIHSLMEHRAAVAQQNHPHIRRKASGIKRIIPGHWLGCCRMLNTIRLVASTAARKRKITSAFSVSGCLLLNSRLFLMLTGHFSRNR
jgi:hypothetical protein